MIALFKKYDLIVFVLLFAIGLFLSRPEINEKHIFAGDDLRYISYAVSLHKHGVFGLLGKNINETPSPGNSNAPLYPIFIASIMTLDQNFADSLMCTHIGGKYAECAQDFNTFFIAQSAMSLLCLFFIYMLAYRFTHSKSIAWLAALCALASGVFQEFSFIFMTEILVLPLFSALLLFCLILYQKNKIIWVIPIGLILAALTLVRPSYLYLFYGFILCFVGLWAYKRNWHSALKAFILTCAFIIAVLPWAIRNKIQFDTYALTTGEYAEAILIQRTNYNQMTWPEIGVTMIYWLPDFGDSLAQRIFPPKWHEKLGWGEDTYYTQGYQNKIVELSEELGSKDRILKHLVHKEILTVKHFAVSIPLAIRGIFISKYWGLIGFFSFVTLAYHTIRQRNFSLLIISMPLFFMVAFHAGLSVSIPRYNLPLIALYALCMAWYIKLYGQKIVSKICK